MAEFIIGSPLRNLAREHQSLRQFLWRVDYALVWTLQKFLQVLPIDMSSRVGYRLGAFIGGRMKHKSAIYRENLAIAFPDMDAEVLDVLVQQAWGQAGRILAEYAHLETILKDPDRLDIEIIESIPTYADPAKPAVFVTAHVSNWEVVCSAMAKMGVPNASLYSPPTNPLLDKLLMDSRRALNCELLPRDNSARGLLQSLKKGRSIAMVMDRRVDEGKAIRFFGHDKQSTIVPARMALKFNCELVPVKVVRGQDARFHITFMPPIRPKDVSADDNSQAIDMIEQVHALFEQWITESPADWFCSKRLWPKGTNASSQADQDTNARSQGIMDTPEEVRDNTDVDRYAN